MRNIGLTGGMGCGKSTVAEFLREMGATIIDADILAREVVIPGKSAYLQIVERFGPDILLKNKSLNRKKLATIVFSDRQALEFLNKVTHLEIAILRNKILAEQFKIKPDSLVVNIVPLLFEVKLQALFQKIILVCLDKETQIKRLMKGRGFTMEEINARLNNQMSQAKKKKKAHYLLDNNGTLIKTKNQLLQMIQDIKTLPHIQP